MRKCISFLLCFTLFNLCFGQRTYIDSLFRICNSINSDTNKALDYNLLARAYIDISQYDSATLISNTNRKFIESKLKSVKDKKVSIRLKNRLIDVYINDGIIAECHEDYADALKQYQLALNLSKELNDKLKMADCYTNIGILFDSQGNMSESIKYYFMSLKNYEELKDKGRMAAAYTNIAYVYTEQDSFDVALKYSLKSLEIEKQLNNKLGVANSFLGIGVIYQNKKQFDEAIKVYNDALPIMIEFEYKEGVANLYNNLGVVYANKGLASVDKRQRKSDLEKALQSHFASLKIKEEINVQYAICTSVINIGYVYTKLGNYAEAKKYLDKGVKLGNEINSRYNLKFAYYYKSQLDSILGDYKSSYNNYKLHVQYRDSLINEETRKRTIQSQMSFDFEKKTAIAEAEHKLQLQNQSKEAEEQSKKQRLIIVFIGFVLLLVIVFAVYVFRSLKISNKQKGIIEMQKQIVEEKHKEINDSINYAERIQRSFLATSDLLNENLKEYFVFFQPKDVVSGDFYWAATKVVNGRKYFYLCTADSTGHGVPGAIMSILNISSLERALENNYLKPAEILNETRKTIINRLKKDGSEEGGKDGMDASLICFDFEKFSMQYASANNPIWVVRSSVGNESVEFIELLPDKMPVGKHDKDQLPFTNNEFELQANDIIYTLTDGLPDQFGGEKGKKFMYKRLKELLKSISHEPMNIQKQMIVDAFEDWKRGVEQIDDVTLIGIKV